MMSFKQIMPADNWYWHHDGQYQRVTAFALNGIGDLVALVYKHGQGNAFYQPPEGELVHADDVPRPREEKPNSFLT
ncbi:MAG: hypothetical protein KGO49_13215 [Gammaproteobacteria bacterium]|nr:hypothetical protein [Gammaproteobacteria bacterium]